VKPPNDLDGDKRRRRMCDEAMGVAQLATFARIGADSGLPKRVCGARSGSLSARSIEGLTFASAQN
jgi:hypothetical protein